MSTTGPPIGGISDKWKARRKKEKKGERRTGRERRKET